MCGSKDDERLGVQNREITNRSTRICSQWIFEQRYKGILMEIVTGKCGYVNQNI